MTDAERPFVDERGEAFRQARIQEIRETPRRDDGALIKLARVIGEKCGVAPTSTEQFDSGSANSHERVTRQPSSPTLIDKGAASGPDQQSQRIELPHFAPAYRTIAQRVKMDWEFDREQRPKPWPPTRTPLDILQVRSPSSPQSYRSLPDVLPLNSEAFNGFDIGKRFLIKWPDQRMPRRVNDYVKLAASAGVIAAAIAGFWGGSVIKSGRSEAIASRNEPKETSALAPGRAIRVESTASVKPGNGSPFGSGPSAFGVNGQGTPVRPSATATAGTKPDFNDGSSVTVQPKSALAAVVAPAAPTVPSTSSAAIETTLKGSVQVQALTALAPSLPASGAPVSANSPTVTSPLASTGPAPSPDSAPAKPDETASGSARGLSHDAVHGKQPIKKRNPLAIVRFGNKGVAAGRLGPRPPGSVPQPSPVAAEHGNDFFLTRFFDKLFRN